MSSDFLRNEISAFQHFATLYKHAAYHCLCLENNNAYDYGSVCILGSQLSKPIPTTDFKLTQGHIVTLHQGYEGELSQLKISYVY